MSAGRLLVNPGFFSPEIGYSYTDNVGCRSWNPSIFFVYYAKVTQHHKDSSRIVDIRGGALYVPLFI